MPTSAYVLGRGGALMSTMFFVLALALAWGVRHQVPRSTALLAERRGAAAAASAAAVE